jgi:glycosyltransferase involved in cell wall biosynthesis
LDIVINLEHRFDRTPDGSIWTQGPFARSFYSQYMRVFDRVRVIARVREVDSVPANAQRADGGGVSFHALPYYVGPAQFVGRSVQVARTVRSAVGASDAVILRVSSPVGSLIERRLRRAGRPYALEVVGDPFDVFSPGSVHHPLRAIFRVHGYLQLKRLCARAPAVAYVTRTALQRRYPAGSGAVSSAYSDVELPPEAYAGGPRGGAETGRRLEIITVGTLDQLYKAQDVLIEAVRGCLKAGLDLRLTLIGDGQYRARLEEQAGDMGDKVRFLGRIPAGAAVRCELDRAGLFILPSRQEGLPRAMVEAMARACPCIGSNVGGIPELLPDSDMVPPNDVAALTRKILEVARTPGRMSNMSARNLETAREYREELLREVRNTFYGGLRDRTEAWLRSAGVSN